MSSWDESKHPRVHSGESAGGQFTSGEGLSYPARGEYAANMPEAQLRLVTRKFFGRAIGRDEAARAAGALPGMTVVLTPQLAGGRGEPTGVIGAHLKLENADGATVLEAFRMLKPDWTINNVLFDVKEPFRGQGVGLRVIESQVDHAALSGFTRITTEASGSGKDRFKTANGSWTWARMGYDGQIPALAGKPPGGARTIHELMSTRAGTDWWRANATTFSGTFDLRPGSTSRRVLAEYARLKREKR